jgi:F0F1-type ATP synthase assembly protein I
MSRAQATTPMSPTSQQEAALPMDPDARAMWREALRHVAVGWEIVIALGIGYLGGWALDRWLHTGPYLSIVGALFGVAAAVRTLVRVVKDYRRAVGPDDPADENRPPKPAWAPRRKKRHDPLADGGDEPPEEK